MNADEREFNCELQKPSTDFTDYADLNSQQQFFSKDAEGIPKEREAHIEGRKKLSLQNKPREDVHER